MRKRLLIAAAVMVAVGLIIYAVLADISSPVRRGPDFPDGRLEFDFRHGVQGWEAGFAEYSREMTGMQLKAEIRRLPPELEVAGRGFYLS